MNDLISRQLVLDHCQKLIDAERKQGSDKMNYGQERVYQTEEIMQFVQDDYLCPSIYVASDAVVRDILETAGAMYMADKISKDAYDAIVACCKDNKIKKETPLRRKSRVTQLESNYLDHGITQC